MSWRLLSDDEVAEMPPSNLRVTALHLFDALANAELFGRGAWLECTTLRANLHRVTMERDGARLSLDAAHEARIKQSLELADARAEVVRLRAALDAAHRLVRRHGNALDAMEEGREAEESAT